MAVFKQDICSDEGFLEDQQLNGSQAPAYTMPGPKEPLEEAFPRQRRPRMRNVKSENSSQYLHTSES